MKDIIEGFKEVIDYTLGDLDLILVGKIIAFISILICAMICLFSFAGIFAIVIKMVVR